MKNANPIPSVSVNYAANGTSTRANELGMRPMQERAYEKRGEQYLLIKSPPASGKSRALMFIALDKLHRQGLRKAIIAVPERSIGSSFSNERLRQSGFWADWEVAPQWNLCNAPGGDNGGKVGAVQAFLHSDDRALVCTHATFRFAVERFGIELFDDCLIAIDEFHHVSADVDSNRLGNQLKDLIARNKVHIVAMTGSYFRGDAVPVLHPEDEARFETVTYTYYEQLNGYEHLKQLDLGYYFYEGGSYLDELHKVLDPDLKTILHIPSVNSRASTQRGKTTEVSEVMAMLGRWQGKDPVTGFDLVERPDGRILKIADLVDDGPERHIKVMTALKDSAHKHNRDHVDIIIALGMAKEGFDWIWCEHALTVGYRSSLTEIIQIIGRATRDAPGKTRARFTNFIAEPAAEQGQVTDAVNDTLKAIAASLLMEQVLIQKMTFTAKNSSSSPQDGFEYEGGYDSGKTNVGFNRKTGEITLEINGLATPKSPEASRICREDLNEVVAAFVQDKTALERGLFDKEDLAPEELTVVRMGKIIRDKYPELDTEDQEAVRQHAIAALNVVQQAKAALSGDTGANPANDLQGSTAFVDGVRRFVLEVRELDIDLIDRINPFGEAYAILAKAMNEDSLKQVEAIIAAKKTSLSYEEARAFAVLALDFKKQRGRLPSLSSADPWERKMAEGIAFLQREAAKAKHG